MHDDLFHKIIHWVSYLFAIIAICIIVAIWSTTSIVDKKTVVVIEEGTSVRAIAQQLEDAGVIRSAVAFNAAVMLFDKDTQLKAGTYVFGRTDSFMEIVARLHQADYQIDIVRVRIPEGLTRLQIADVLFNKLSIPQAEFMALTEDKEGYLFPDTYDFYITTTVDEVVETLLANFDDKIATLELNVNEVELDKIVTMASIVEREASATSKQEVADILWHRLSIDMALQVDATFVYERNLNSFQLTYDDLREDSPYNTYTRPGLPPTPISNPGLASLRAAAFPNQTPYLFFLTGHDGEMYYAETFEQHKVNKNLHLR